MNTKKKFQDVTLTEEQHQKLLHISLKGKNHRSVYMYLRGPISNPSVFRCEVYIRLKVLQWPKVLGHFEEYEVLRFKPTK